MFLQSEKVLEIHFPAICRPKKSKPRCPPWGASHGYIKLITLKKLNIWEGRGGRGGVNGGDER